MKKSLYTALTLVLTVIVLAGCAAPAPSPAQDSAGEPSSEQPAASDEEVTLRMTWWGNDARHALYNELLDMYEEQNPNVTVEREFSGWSGYWDKLATQVAAGNAPDLIIMHLNYINEYAERGALQPLDSYVESGEMDLSNFSRGAISTGEVDGTLYMITLGLTPRALFYNPTLFEEAGAELPTMEWTWDDFQTRAIAISDALGEDVYGAGDQGMDGHPYWTWLGQQGKGFFEDGEIGFTREDLIEWWSMWESLRDAGAIPPAELASEAPEAHADHMLTHAQTAMHMSPGNQFKLFQDYAEDELEITAIPQGTGEDAVPFYYAGGAFMAISDQTEHSQEIVDLIDWFVNDPEVARIYNGEHGPPGSTEMQEVIIPNLEPADQKLYEFSGTVADEYAQYPEQIPQGGEVTDAFVRAYDELRFDRMTLEEAVDFFFEEAEFILGS